MAGRASNARFENETMWLTQAFLAELFEKDVRTLNEHLVNISDEGELRREATNRRFRIVRIEGKREVVREIEHYNLDAILPRNACRTRGWPFSAMGLQV